MAFSSELINSSNMEQQLEEASAQLDLSLIRYQQITEAYKKRNPGTEKVADLDKKIREVSEALSDTHSLEIVANDENLARMCQPLEDLELMDERRKTNEDEEEQQREKPVLDTLTVPSDQIGLVAGKQFVNKLRLESTYGIKVTIPARGEGNAILLLGPADQVAAAKINILKDLPIKLTYEVDQRLIHSIRNYDAMAIEALRREHNVSIKFGSTEVYIEGRKSGCEKVLTAIQSITAQRSALFLNAEARQVVSAPQPPVNIEEKVVVPEDMLGFIAGKQFVNAKRLEKTYGVKVVIPAKNMGNVIVLQGPDADKLAAARKDIIECLPVTLTQPIDPQFVGLIIGYKWEGIRRLINEYDVKSIEFDDKKMVIIKGKKDCCEAALKAINAIVDKRKEMDRAATASRRAVHVVADYSRP